MNFNLSITQRKHSFILDSWFSFILLSKPKKKEKSNKEETFCLKHTQKKQIIHCVKQNFPTKKKENKKHLTKHKRKERKKNLSKEIHYGPFNSFIFVDGFNDDDDIVNRQTTKKTRILCLPPRFFNLYHNLCVCASFQNEKKKNRSQWNSSSSLIFHP